jgi:hypothetical protein
MGVPVSEAPIERFMSQVRDELVEKLKSLVETLWTGVVDWPMILRWLDNFAPDEEGADSERLHALFLLSQFMYFGSRELRELLRSVYRDLYRYPIIHALRRTNGDTTNCDELNALFADELERTRFLGVGNPSESGTHLLYYFRQENSLKRDLFANVHDIFIRMGGGPTVGLRWPDVTRYVFLDDLCGSGTQAVEYSNRVVNDLKRTNPSVYVAYYALFATTSGLAYARARTAFDSVQAVLELDHTFKCFDLDSRYFKNSYPEIKQPFADQMCRGYGARLLAAWPLGYKDGQLLIGFFHNVPDNALPILWHDGTPRMKWVPIFRRYPKLYQWGGV